jgi:hypothetical protein
LDVTDSTPLPTRSRQKPFAQRFSGVRLSADQAKRHGLIVQLAHVLLGRDEATLFLNTRNEALGARPLDIAISGEAGFSIVEMALQWLAHPQSGALQ